MGNQNVRIGNLRMKIVEKLRKIFSMYENNIPLMNLFWNESRPFFKYMICMIAEKIAMNPCCEKKRE